MKMIFGSILIGVWLVLVSLFFVLPWISNNLFEETKKPFENENSNYIFRNYTKTHLLNISASTPTAKDFEDDYLW